MGSVAPENQNSEEELDKLVQIPDSDDEEVEIDHSAVRIRICEIAEKIALPGETLDSATSRALCFNHVYKGRYSIDVQEDEEFEEWRRGLESKVKSIKRPFKEDREPQALEVPYRKRSHSVMAGFSFRKKPDFFDDEDVTQRASRYRNEYLLNREKQRVPDLKEMDEFESKLLDKAISHLINIENQCQGVKKQRTYRETKFKERNFR
ncbi:hypothetical protein FO519_004938 [Halicephalobus sp. NKZ332]|nr:hypothetical protein FO519_004938 [Halicephalobus sp. NKZ332]